MPRDFETALARGQLVLFLGLAVPESPPRAQCLRIHPPAIACVSIQLVIELRERIEIDPDETPDAGDYPTHAIVSARNCEPVTTKGHASIFALAQEVGAERTARQVIAEFMLWPDGEPPQSGKVAQAPVCRKVIRDGDVTRHIALREQDTDEWAEKERARRARQKPPRPKKQTFKMKGTRAWADAQT